MKRRQLAVVAVLVALVAGLFGAGTASAAPAKPAATTPSMYFSLVPANGKVNCFNYIGTLMPGSYVAVVSWSTTGPECFGVTSDRRIWHAWRGAGWQVMPGNGRADDSGDYYAEWADGSRSVSAVANGSNWCQAYTRAGGWDGVWYHADVCV